MAFTTLMGTLSCSACILAGHNTCMCSVVSHATCFAPAHARMRAGGRTSRLVSELVLSQRMLSASVVPGYPGEKRAGMMLVYGVPAPGAGAALRCMRPCAHACMHGPCMGAATLSPAPHAPRMACQLLSAAQPVRPLLDPFNHCTRVRGAHAGPCVFS